MALFRCGSGIKNYIDTEGLIGLSNYSNGNEWSGVGTLDTGASGASLGNTYLIFANCINKSSIVITGGATLGGLGVTSSGVECIESTSNTLDVSSYEAIILHYNCTASARQITITLS